MSSETILVTRGGLRLHVTAPAVVPFTNTLADSTAPRSADEAAQRLLDNGQHVHFHSDGETRCLNDRCAPVVGEALTGSAP